MKRVLVITLITGEIVRLKIEENGDQAGLFYFRGDASQARRYGYVAKRGDIAISLNGNPGPDIELIPLTAIKSMTEISEE